MPDVAVLGDPTLADLGRAGGAVSTSRGCGPLIALPYVRIMRRRWAAAAHLDPANALTSPGAYPAPWDLFFKLCQSLK
jgi:hypothetical protein